MALLDDLTEREIQVLSLMTDGLTNREISEQLVLSFETVRWYTKEIYSKLGVHSRTQAILSWQELDQSKSSTEVSDASPAMPFSNLPEYPSSFVGREAELNDIQNLILRQDARLITIVGAGGMGKTRLAIESAKQCHDHFPHGLFFVSCTHLITPSEILATISQQLNRPSDSPPQELVSYLQDRKALLILDTFEHLIDGAEILSHLLTATRYLTILVTSRNALNLRIEWVRTVEALTIPQVNGKPAVAGAIKLFEDRALRILPEFSIEDELEAVWDICELVDGMPLAIELATAWLKMLPCSDIADEIRQNIDFLATNQRDIDERHRSIRAVFNQSWDLLSDEERKVMGRLSFFRGGFSLQTARQVAHASLDTLSNLVDKSLIRYDAKGHEDFQAGHYHIHDLLRQYVEEKLVQVSFNTLSVRTGMFVTWSAFVTGNFERVEELIDDIFSPSTQMTSDLVRVAFGLALSGILAGLAEDYESCQQMCETSLVITQRQKVVDSITLLFARVGVAIAGCGMGHYHNAEQSIRSALQLAQQLDTPAFSFLCLPVIIITKVHHAEFEIATQILAFFHAHPANVPTWLHRWQLLKNLETSLQLELGEEVFANHWQRGQNLNLPSLVERLLAE